MPTEPPQSSGPPSSGDAHTSLLVRGAAAGDLAQLEELVQKLAPLLLAQASYRLGPLLRTYYDAEDLVHEAWLVALPRLGALSPRDGRMTPVLLRFLGTTILNKANKLLRKHVSGKPRPVAGPASGATAPIDRASDPASGVITKATRGEQERRVRDLLDALSPGDREILILRGIEQRTNQEAADQLRIEPNAAAVRYHRALEHARQAAPGSVLDELA